MKQSGLHVSFGGRCRWGKSRCSLHDVDAKKAAETSPLFANKNGG